MRFARSREKNKFFFASFHFKFFASNQSEINKSYFRFVSRPKFFRFASFRFWFFCFASKRNEINVFSLCFALKRNELNIFFSLPFTSLGVDLKNWKTDLNIFLRFFTDCPRISLYPFLLWSFRFFFVFFASFHFHTLFSHQSEKNFGSVSLHFASKRKLRQFRFFFVSFSLCFIFVSLQISTFRIDAKQAKKSLFFASKRKKFRFRFASFRFEAKMTAHPNIDIHTGRPPPPNTDRLWTEMPLLSHSRYLECLQDDVPVHSNIILSLYSYCHGLVLFGTPLILV